MLRSVSNVVLSKRLGGGLSSLQASAGRPFSSLTTFRLGTFHKKNQGILPNTISSLSIPQQCRYYTAMTKEEEEEEKARVSHLTPEQTDSELRELNRQLAKLEMLRGINNGELYTWSGKYKALMRDYGFPLFVYYWVVWSTMGAGMYLAIGVGGLDAMEVLGRFDDWSGYSLSNQVDPQLGKIGLALVLNELMEPIRLPFVVATLKPAMEIISPPKY
jgi:hypothetical protein